MMDDLHEHYDKLTDGEKAAVDGAYNHLSGLLANCNCGIAGDDRAERVVDAIARGVIESRGIHQRPSDANRMPESYAEDYRYDDHS